MENFGAFYEQIVSLTWITLGSISVLLILGRLGQLFFRYIDTGEVGEFYESCYAYHLMDGDGFDPRYISFLYRGTHPGAIITDFIGYAVIILFAGLAWLPVSIILPFIGIAYLLRKRIAKKRDFVAKLDGTHPDLHGSGSESQASITQSNTGGP